MRLYNGVRLLGNGPCLRNVELLDRGVWPMVQFMAKTGMQVDLTHFAIMEQELTRDMDRITESVRSVAGRHINIDSGDQVAKLLFDDLGLKQAHPKMTDSGARESVEDEVLIAIQHDHPVVPMILEYKEFSKLRGTYVRPMPKLARRVAHGEWRMFPNFSTTRVPSGRFACKEPNLLAMPTRTERGKDIRRGFITKPGWTMVSVDQSQIEVRMAAHYSGDPNLIRVYEEEEDVYSDFATSSFNLPDERHQGEDGKWIYPTVDKNAHRRPAKTCVLASIYDVTAGGLLEQMPVICANCNLEATKHTCSKFQPLWNEENCQEQINAFYLRYPGILRDRAVHHKRAMRLGYCWDIWGRLLHVAAVRSVHPWVVSAALREAGNFPYQAGACGTLKLTMAKTMDDLEGGSLLDLVHPLLPLHDELIIECREDLADDVIGLVAYNFETCAPLRVPIKASGGKAPNWGDLEH